MDLWPPHVYTDTFMHLHVHHVYVNTYMHPKIISAVSQYIFTFIWYIPGDKVAER